MPSFTRRAPTSNHPPPAGTHPSTSTPTLNLLPTGLPSLDDLLGGGAPLGSVLLILAPDPHTSWARLVERYWIAQGLLTGQRELFVGEEGESMDVVRGCMWVDEGRSGGRGTDSFGTSGSGKAGSESEGEGVGGEGEGRGGGRIAWRYERMKRFRTTVGQGGGPELSLTTTVPAELLEHVESTDQLTYIDLDSGEGPSRRDTYSTTIEKLHASLARADEGVATRVTVHDLGSLDWGEVTSHGIHRILHSLRSLIRNKSASALVTLPSFLARSPPPGSEMTNEAWVKSLAWAVDGCIELRGFGDDPTLPALFPHSHGLLTLHSFPTSRHLLPPTLKSSFLLGAGENNLGFRLKRKRFVIETVHLGVEGGVGERRTEPVPEVGRLLAPTSQPQPSSRQVEGVERVEKVVGDVGMARPRGPKDEKKRGKVRFGGEEVEPGGDHKFHPGPAKPVVRHDRMDLYDF